MLYSFRIWLLFTGMHFLPLLKISTHISGKSRQNLHFTHQISSTSLGKLNRQSAPACAVALRPSRQIGRLENTTFNQVVWLIDKTIEFQSSDNRITLTCNSAGPETYFNHYLAHRNLLWPFTIVVKVSWQICHVNHLHHGNQSACFNRIQETVQLVLTKRD